ALESENMNDIAQLRTCMEELEQMMAEEDQDMGFAAQGVQRVLFQPPSEETSTQAQMQELRGLLIGMARDAYQIPVDAPLSPTLVAAAPVRGTAVNTAEVDIFPDSKSATELVTGEAAIAEHGALAKLAAITFSGSIVVDVRPRLASISDCPADSVAKKVARDAGLCVAQFNAKSVYDRQSKGFRGKRRLMRIRILGAQFEKIGLRIVGFQDSRNPEGIRMSGPFLAVSSGAASGGLGCELWLDMEEPLATHKDKE
ncbi:unnamed protein product, partial [Prorocentrum cordatum]